MKTTEQIVKEARESYENYFKDAQEYVSPKYDDIVLNKQKLTEDIKKMETMEKTKHQSLEILREQVIQEAEKSFHKIFKDAKEAKPTPKMSVNEMYDALNKEKERLSHIAQKLKEQQLHQ